MEKTAQMPVEIWRDIEGYEGEYQVSNLGQVRSFKWGRIRILIPQRAAGGYVRVLLKKSGESEKNYLVHRLVASAFISNPDNKPQVNHKSGNKKDNQESNLEWNTRQENQEHSARILGNNNGMKCHLAKLTDEIVLEIRSLHSTGRYSNVALARLYRVTPRNIGHIVNRTSWSHI